MPEKQVPDPHVGDIWYRYEDKWYSVADEYGDHSHSSLEIHLLKSTVIKVTPKGVWVAPGELDLDYITRHELSKLRIGYEQKFICHGWTKKYCCATKEEALKSLEARRQRQKSIYEARARAAGEVLLRIEMERKKLLNMEGY